MNLGILLSSLLSQTYKDWHLILISSNTEDILKDNNINLLIKLLVDHGHDVKVINQDPENIDVGKLRQVALDNDPNEFGCRIDDDSYCEPNYLELLMKAYLSKDKVGAVGGVFPYITNPQKAVALPPTWNWVMPRWYDTDDNSVSTYNHLNPELCYEAGHLRSSFLYKNEIAREIGYNEGYPTGFREETDFTIRMKLAGYKLLIVPTAVAWHFATIEGNPQRFNHKIKYSNDQLYKRRMREWEEKYHV